MFKDKVVVITGSSSGIGRSLALSLASEGAHLVLADINPPEPVGSVIGHSEFHETDVGREKDIRQLIDRTYAKHGRIDYFFSNAGMTIEMDASVTEEDWNRIVAVNQTSHVRVARHLVPRMVAAGGGHLIITASGSSFLSEIMSMGYAATKYAAYAIAEWLSFTYRTRGLKVAVVCPGPVWTPLIDDIPYLHEGAITADEAAAKTLEGVRGGQFFIITHADLAQRFRDKAAAPGAYVDLLVQFRDHALALREAALAKR